MRKVILWISVLILMTGCRTSLQSNWKNFNAYYNTFYNAEKSFEAGLKKNQAQSREYNPLQPIRIHLKPVSAGAQDFDKAITKSADILRRHEDSKWVDDAVFLIGKSYYYRQDFFSADQKFRELYITSDVPEMQHKSIVWQGRVLLELELFTEGIAFLSDQISVFEQTWDKKTEAEARAMLAQHYVGTRNWEAAINELSVAVEDLPGKGLRERGYFLLGQLYERTDNMEAAFDAYYSVQDHFSEYRVQYLAQRKRAEVARVLGRNDLAFEIFDDMIRDDKNLEYRSELDFELAKTEHERRNYKQAQVLYNNVLHNRNSQPPAEIKAQAYYGLAEIQRFGFDNFSKAAAYYDSAAQVNVQPERLPEDFEAQTLAESFGNYARIKSELAHQDSLLRLGQMSKVELDSVLAEIRLQKIRELEQAREQQERQQNQMVNVDRGNENTETTQNTGNGFLNENSLVTQQNQKQQFFALWGNRPLADNWRVRSMIEASTYSEEVSEERLIVDDSELLNIEIDLSNIPFTDEEQDSVRKQIATYDYELGNLFFLSLSIPDSAVHYFEKAIQRPSNDNINMVSLYSLSELYSNEGNKEKSREYALRLTELYPETVYAERLSEKFGISLEQNEEGAEEVSPVEIYNSIVEQENLPISEKAQKLKTFSLAFSDYPIAPRAQFESIEAYMSAGKENENYQKNIRRWVDLKRQNEQASAEFNTLLDSARNMLQDSTLSDEQRIEFQALTDSTFQPLDTDQAFPYRGAHWDSARAVIDTFLVMFPDSRLKPRVTRLNEELRLPSSAEEKKIPVQEQDAERPASPEGYRSCEEVDQELTIRGGKDSFLNDMRSSVQDNPIELIYRFKVNQRGIIDDYTLLTEGVAESVAEEFASHIEGYLSFEPVLYQGQAIAVECEINFSLQN